jgi:hypothetical protein
MVLACGQSVGFEFRLELASSASSASSASLASLASLRRTTLVGPLGVWKAISGTAPRRPQRVLMPCFLQAKVTTVPVGC